MLTEQDFSNSPIVYTTIVFINVRSYGKVMAEIPVLLVLVITVTAREPRLHGDLGAELRSLRLKVRGFMSIFLMNPFRRQRKGSASSPSLS